MASVTVKSGMQSSVKAGGKDPTIADEAVAHGTGAAEQFQEPNATRFSPVLRLVEAKKLYLQTPQNVATL